MEIKQYKSVWAAAALLLVNLIYGASHVLAKGVMPTFLSPAVFIAFRVFGAVVLFWLSWVWMTPVRVERQDILRFAVCGLFGVTTNQLLFFYGLSASSPMNAGIIMAMNPMMVALLSVVIRKERLSMVQLFGMALGAIGAIALTTSGNKTLDAKMGDLFLLGNSLSYALYLIMVKPLMNKYPPLQVITLVFSFGSIFLFLFPPLYFDASHTNFQAITTEAWAKIGFVVVAVTYLTYLLTVVGLRHVSSTVASVFIYLQPIFVILFSFLLSYLGWAEDYTQSISLTTIFLMFIIFIGVYLTTNAASRN